MANFIIEKLSDGEDHILRDLVARHWRRILHEGYALRGKRTTEADYRGHNV